MLLSGKGDELLKAHSMYEIALLHYKMGRPKKGIQGLKESLAVFEKRDYPKGIADCLKALGNILSADGDSKGAETHYRRASEAYKKAGRASSAVSILKIRIVS